MLQLYHMANSAITKLHTISQSDLEFIVSKSRSFREILTNLGLSPTKHRYKVLHTILDKFNISFVTTWVPSGVSKLRPLSEVLTVNSTYTIEELKRRLIKEGLLKIKCYNAECSISTSWLNNPITLQIDHINGVNNDNRIENLRLLCPNCHSQTPTYAGRRNKKPPNLCQICETKPTKFKYCKSCAASRRNTNTKQVSDETLIELFNQGLTVYATAVSVGLSWHSVNKRRNRFIKLGLLDQNRTGE